MVEFLVLVGVAFLLAYGLGIVFVFWSERHGAPWVPTPLAKVRQMLVLAEVKPGDIVYDLGSGDGRVLLIAGREFGARAVGVEISLLRCLWTRLLILLFGLRGQVRVIWGDLFDQDIQDADVVTLFLRRATNDLLMVKLLLELRPGTRIISHKFTFSDWIAEKKDEQARLYFYRVGMQEES